ncbi:UDP-sugar transporter sqv-7 [Aphelenchoides fujianensis]|nr:UDP-sugar transporter sqv-7 [Aphelenchoides fujianensis]
MPTEATSFAKIGSAVFFGVTSVLIVFVNKILLTNLRFPSFLYLGLGQMSMTLVVLFVAERCGLVSFPRCDRTMPRRIFPLPIFYLLNLISGLGGTQKLNLPMFTVLRRISILLTMVFEFFLLKMQFPFAIKVSVFLMIFGSFIAAIYDLTFDAYGYTLIMINNICTAANVVYTKKKLDAKDLGQYGLLYYNALFMIVPAMFIALLSDDTERVREFVAEGNFTGAVWFCFILSSICGFILNYSSVLCTHYNSPLTTTCVGPIKNLFVTYVGMISSGDYIFQWANFIGVNLSVLGSILYTYVTFRRKGLQNSRQITVNPVEKEKLIP